MRKKAKCNKQDVNRSGAWSSEEDKILMNYVKLHGEGKWRQLSKSAGLKRSGKSCRLRWLNYLKPDIKRGNISSDEEDLIIRLHNLLGNRWSLIAGRLPGRTDNEIKNYWNTHLRKKLGHKPNNSSSNKVPIKLSTAESPGSTRNNSLATRDNPTKSSHSMMPANDSVNTMNIVTAASGGNSKNSSTSASTPQIDSPGFLKDFEISDDMLIPNEDCDHFNRYACVQIPQQFGDDDAFGLADSYSISEAWYENWKIDDLIPPELEAVDFLDHFLNFLHDGNG